MTNRSWYKTCNLQQQPC